MKFTGDISELGKLADNLRSLGEVPSRSATAAASGIADDIALEFYKGNDPYGTPWAPLADATIRKGRRAPPLTDSGALADSIEVKPMRGAGISVTIGEDYGSYHQWGTSRMPARKILPEAELPTTWETSIRLAGDQAVARAMGGK